MKKPASVIGLAEFKNTCAAEDIVITFWQQQDIFAAIKNCPAKRKIFWQHGIIIPRYADFNGERYFQSGVFTDFWNVSAACASYIKERYALPEVKIVHPFFDDDTLLEYFAKKEQYQREGILILRRRGQEAIPDIISLFPEQKITILPKTFSDSELYEQLIRNKFFISTDNGIGGKLLIKNKSHRWLKTVKRMARNIFKTEKAGQLRWVKPRKNLLGFPVTAAEAAWLGATVIGFAMGGGLEWMSKDNMYLSADENIDSLLEKIKEALSAAPEELAAKTKLASASVQRFSRENTWKQLAENLKLR